MALGGVGWLKQSVFNLWSLENIRTYHRDSKIKLLNLVLLKGQPSILLTRNLILIKFYVKLSGN
jgi:hypothetical protein